MQILLRDTRQAVRFPTEHLAALIKPHLINSDKREKDRGSERGRIGENLQPRHRFFKKARERGVGGGAKLHSKAGAKIVVEEDFLAKASPVDNSHTVRG